MESDGRSKIVMGIGVILCLISLAGIAYSYRLYGKATRMEQANRRDLQSLQSNLSTVSDTLARLDKRMNSIEGKTDRMASMQIASQGPGEPGQMDRRPPGPPSQIQKPHNGMRPGGFAGDEDFEEPAQKADDYTRSLMKRREMLARLDAQKYGDRLATLADAARTSRDGANGDERAKLAFEELLNDYPDSYSTAVAIGENALQSALNSDVEKVEAYYDMLRDHNLGDAAVTDQGVEALPAVESYLAYHYTQAGDRKKAEEYIRTIEDDEKVQYIAEPGPGGTPQWKPKDVWVREMKQQAGIY